MANDQSREEMDAHLSSPAVQTADLWMTATVQHQRFDVSWYLMAAQLRLGYVQQFLARVVQFPDWRDEVESRGDLEELHLALVPGPIQDRLWRLLADELSGAWADAYGEWWPRRVIESHPRAVDIEHETVMFADHAQLPDTRDADHPPPNSLTAYVTLEGGLYQIAGFVAPSPQP